MSAPPSERVHTRAVVELLSHAFDYAGLYPPAGLSMDAAAREYAAQRRGPHAWALGRFVVGAAQWDAFIAVRKTLGGEAWPISLLVAQTVELPDLTAQAELVRVAAVETKATTADEVNDLAPLKSVASELYVELPLVPFQLVSPKRRHSESPDVKKNQAPSPLAGIVGTARASRLELLIDAVKALGARAKIRTGGVTHDAIPPADSVARFIRACVRAGVPFKATAGLHHIVRGDYALTYEPESAKATMFGYLNVCVASVLASRRVAFDTLVQVLEERDVRAFATGQKGDLCWREHCLTSAELRSARERIISGVGSCSFSEPIAELRTAGLLGST